MEIEKLIEKLRTESLYKDKATLEIMDLCMDAALALEQLQAENDRLKEEVQQMRWIPVEERLPGDSDGLVIMTDGEIVHPSYGDAMFGSDGKFCVFAPTKRKPWGFMQVTHWMHLPKAPKEEKKDG